MATTYYIDFAAGSDSNAGTSKGSPWKNHPYMQNWAGTYSHASGDHFIFKGGVTWTSACFPLVPLAGGNGSGNDYYGVDITWFSGGSFVRPIWDGEHIASSIMAMDFPHQGAHRITIDSLEMKRITCAVADGPGLITLYDTDNILIENCYVHDWLLNPLLSSDGYHGGIIGAYDSSAPAGIVNIVYDSCEISNAENGASGKWSGMCIRYGGVVRNCLIHDNSNAIVFAQDVDHCTIYNIAHPYNGFDPAFHWNGFYMDNGNGSGSTSGVNLYCRNTIFHDVSSGANMAYPNVEKYDCYIYNCLFYGVLSTQQAIEIDPYDFGGTGLVMSCYIYNNTLDITSLSSTTQTGIIVVSRAGVQINNLIQKNNLFISPFADVSGLSSGTSAGILNAVATNNLASATLSSAGVDGAYVPQAGSPAIGVGSNLIATLPALATDLAGVSRPAMGAWTVGGYTPTGAPLIVSPSVSTVSASPGSVVADGATTSTVTVTLLDGSSVPVSGKTVTLAKTFGAGSPTISAASGASSVLGVVTFTVKSTTAAADTFTATDTTDSITVIQTATVTFTAGTVSTSTSTVTASPASIVADGITTSMVTVTLRDSNSNPVSGKTVTLAHTSGAGSPTISAASGPSSVGGVVTFTVKSATAATDVFTATDTTDSSVITQTASVTFTTPGVHRIPVITPDKLEREELSAISVVVAADFSAHLAAQVAAAGYTGGTLATLKSSLEASVALDVLQGLSVSRNIPFNIKG